MARGKPACNLRQIKVRRIQRKEIPGAPLRAGQRPGRKRLRRARIKKIDFIVDRASRTPSSNPVNLKTDFFLLASNGRLKERKKK